jgi:hypothetical protein
MIFVFRHIVDVLAVVDLPGVEHVAPSAAARAKWSSVT